MKTKFVCAAAVLALAACGQGSRSGGGSSTSGGDAGAPSATAPSTTSEASAPGQTGMPRQRVGLWRIAMNVAPGMPPVNTEACVTQDMANEVAAMGRPGAGMPGSDCDAPQMRREGDALVGASTCRMQGQTTTTRFRITGDLQSRYQMEITNDTPQGAQTMRMEMTYAGPCSG